MASGKFPVLTAEQIAAAFDLAEIEYDVPEWKSCIKLKAFHLRSRRQAEGWRDQPHQQPGLSLCLLQPVSRIGERLGRGAAAVLEAARALHSYEEDLAVTDREWLLGLVRGLRWGEQNYDRSGMGRMKAGEYVGFNMLSIKPANDTEEFYRAVAKFNQ